jgi:hypothetical protein
MKKKGRGLEGQKKLTSEAKARYPLRIDSVKTAGIPSEAGGSPGEKSATSFEAL